MKKVTIEFLGPQDNGDHYRCFEEEVTKCINANTIISQHQSALEEIRQYLRNTLKHKDLTDVSSEYLISEIHEMFHDVISDNGIDL